MRRKRLHFITQPGSSGGLLSPFRPLTCEQRAYARLISAPGARLIGRAKDSECEQSLLCKHCRALRSLCASLSQPLSGWLTNKIPFTLQTVTSSCSSCGHSPSFLNIRLQHVLRIATVLQHDCTWKCNVSGSYIKILLALCFWSDTCIHLQTNTALCSSCHG